jgi:Holliday junction resolvasome RuvABC endonuclease subunit
VIVRTLSNRTLSVDPGLNGTGWAIWDDGQNIRKELTKTPWRLVDHGAFTPRGDSIQERVALVCSHIRNILLSRVLVEGVRECTVAVEHPQYFAGAGATNASGALVTLAMTVGAVLAATSTLANTHPLLVPLSWKGNLPKEICCKRIIERVRRDPAYYKWKPNTNTTHEIDAIGIGLHLQGRF